MTEVLVDPAAVHKLTVSTPILVLVFQDKVTMVGLDLVKKDTIAQPAAAVVQVLLVDLLLLLELVMVVMVYLPAFLVHQLLMLAVVVVDVI
jgi:hypothetical protein